MAAAEANEIASIAGTSGPALYGTEVRENETAGLNRS
jgi:hypothetical protein